MLREFFEKINVEITLMQKGQKKWQTDIAPLQPSTLACFRTWGSSTGAGRADLPLQK